jgi:osmotically-inducible protein OsmY
MRLILSSLLLCLTALSGCAHLPGSQPDSDILTVEDRRTSGTATLDEVIELRAALRWHESPIEGVHARFSSFNRRLLITGEAPTEQVKARLTDTMRGLTNVQSVANELVILPPTSQASRAQDDFVAARLKTRLLDDNDVNPHHIKIVVENGTAFLMGLVKRDEGQNVAEIAAQTRGVHRVVKLFEYLDKP